jgi:hypothetical protein
MTESEDQHVKVPRHLDPWSDSAVSIIRIGG